MAGGGEALADLAALEREDGFARRHIGPSESDIAAMLPVVGAATLDDLIDRAVPAAIRATPGALPEPLGEAAVLAELRGLAARNVARKSLIGQGYYGTHTPVSYTHLDVYKRQA